MSLNRRYPLVRQICSLTSYTLITTILLICNHCHGDILAPQSSTSSPELSSAAENAGDDTTAAKDLRGLFSPRMDYDQWKPIGRGDPLKNDPTYDYVPPVLERVHYWIDPALRKPDPPVPSESKKTEILVLGVSSKKPSTVVTSQAESRRDPYDPFLKFVDGPKFSMHHHSTYSRPQKHQYTMPSTYYSSAYYPTKQKYDSNMYAVKEEQRVPYTMLMPPPVQESLSMPITFSEESNQTSTPTVEVTIPTTEPTVSIAASNLIYQSSSSSSEDEWKDGKTQFATLAASSSQVTWKTPTPKPPKLSNIEEFNRTHFTFSTNDSDEGFGSTSNEQMTPIQIAPSSAETTFISPLASNVMNGGMQVLHIAGDQPTMAHMTVGGVPMHKGQVTDDTMDIDSSYVNIGKPNAQVHPSSLLGHSSSSQIHSQISHINTNKHLESSMNSMSHNIGVHTKPTATKPNFIVRPTPLSMLNLNSVSNIYKKPSQPPTSRPSLINIPPVTLQTMETMQTMLPPPISDSHIMMPQKPSTFLQNLLQKESTPTTNKFMITTSETTTFLPPTTTASTSLTTDALFSHYKQPAAPLRGPMYLIIQGHSKVKTYGATKGNVHGIPIQETNEISHSDDESNTNFRVKHLHTHKTEEPDEETNENERIRVSKDLQTLQHVLDTGLGAFDVTTIPMARQKREFEIHETELGAKYDVSKIDHTSEKYRKGIVEVGDISDRTKLLNAYKTNISRNKRQLTLEDLIPVGEEVAEEIFDILGDEGSGLISLISPELS